MIVARLGAWTMTALLAASLAPPVDPWIEANSAAGAAIVGILGGAMVFACLARRGISRTACGAISRRTLVARTTVLVIGAAREEAVWRGLVLGLLASATGRVAALLGSTLLFAASHLRRQGSRAAVHLATGSAFGLAYLGTGHLSAAIGAHAAYNTLVGIGLLTSPAMAVLATSERLDALVRSPSATRPPPRRVTFRPVPPTSLASLRAVSKSFGPVRALDGVDLELHRGDVLGLLGPNGAGKSTAISLLLGLRRPDTGRVRLFGLDPRDAAARRRLGVVLQEPSLPPVLRAGEMLDLVRAHFRDPLPRDELLARFDLENVARTQIGGLSGGQRRRLVLAAALAGRPEALLLDEPTAAIDAAGRRVLWDALSTFVAEGGAVLLTTQQLEEAERYATRVVLIARGSVVGEGSVESMRARVGRTRVTLRAERLPPLPPTASASSTLDRHVVYVDDPEAFVAQLVRSGIAYRELEVARPTLEDAFVALTGERE